MERVDHPYAHHDEHMAVLEPDHVLAGRALHDRAAFAELYQRYLTPVYGYCYRRLGSREAAEDATSLVFTKALEGLPTLHNPNIRAWIFTIAHNVVVDTYRNRRSLVNLDAISAVESPDRMDEAALLALDLDELRRALAVLTEDQRQVVELRLTGLKGPEIQEVLGRSRSWVNTTQFRAVQQLRRVLVPEEEMGDDQ